MPLNLKSAATLFKAVVADSESDNAGDRMQKRVVKVVVFAALGALAFMKKDEVIQYMTGGKPTTSDADPAGAAAVMTAPESLDEPLSATEVDYDSLKPPKGVKPDEKPVHPKTPPTATTTDTLRVAAPESVAAVAPTAAPSKGQVASGKIVDIPRVDEKALPKAPSPVAPAAASAAAATPKVAPATAITKVASTAPPPAPVAVAAVVPTKLGSGVLPPSMPKDPDNRTIVLAMAPYVDKVQGKDGQPTYKINEALIKKVSTQAIIQAAKITGVDAGYLAAKAAVESQFRPYSTAGYNDTQLIKRYYGPSGPPKDALTGPSTAKGMFQFLTGTYREQYAKAKKDYPKVDLVDSPFDPLTSAILGANYLKSNMAALNQGRKNTISLNTVKGSVAGYLTHFLGGGGAKKFFREYEANRNNPVSAGMTPAQMTANPNLVHTVDPKTKVKRVATLQEFYDRIADKFKDRRKYAEDVNAEAKTAVALVNIPEDDVPVAAPAIQVATAAAAAAPTLAASTSAIAKGSSPQAASAATPTQIPASTKPAPIVVASAAAAPPSSAAAADQPSKSATGQKQTVATAAASSGGGHSQSQQQQPKHPEVPTQVYKGKDGALYG